MSLNLFGSSEVINKFFSFLSPITFLLFPRLYVFEVGRTFHIFSCVGPFHSSFGHVEHLPLLGLGHSLDADLLVLLYSVVRKVPAAVLTSHQIVPGLGGEEGPPGRGGGGAGRNLLLYCGGRRDRLFGIFDFYLDSVVAVVASAVVGVSSR